MILCKEQFAKQIDKAIFPGTQGGPLMHTIAAKAVCFGEALKPEFKQNNLATVDNNVVTHKAFNKGSTEVIICEPRTYGESVEFVKYLKDKKSIIVNLNFLDSAQACRLVDFLCGATHALNGNQSKISENVFIFTPMSVELSAEPQNNKMVKDALWS